jgi:hypothetical protein
VLAPLDILPQSLLAAFQMRHRLPFVLYVSFCLIGKYQSISTARIGKNPSARFVSMRRIDLRRNRGHHRTHWIPFISLLMVMVAVFVADLRSESQKSKDFLWRSTFTAGIVIL